MLSFPGAGGEDARRNGAARRAPRAPSLAGARRRFIRGGDRRPRAAPRLGARPRSACGSSSPCSRATGSPARRPARRQRRQKRRPRPPSGWVSRWRSRCSLPTSATRRDVGGVRLGLGSAGEVAETATAMLARVRAARPDARVEGVLVQRMAPPGTELLLGMVRDAAVRSHGRGGLRRDLRRGAQGHGGASVPSRRGSRRSKCSRSCGWRRCSRACEDSRRWTLDALAETICRFARLAVDAADVVELEINPLVASADGVIAVDARARL